MVHSIDTDILAILIILIMMICALFCVSMYYSLRVKELKAANAELLSQANKDRQKERESDKNSSLAISKSRALLGEAQRRIETLEATLRSMRQSLIALPLPGDMTSAGGRTLIYLAIYKDKGGGVGEVIIPGTYSHFPLHFLTDKQTDEEREVIYETLRENSAAQRELALRMLWNFID